MSIQQLSHRRIAIGIKVRAKRHNPIFRWSRKRVEPTGAADRSRLTTGKDGLWCRHHYGKGRSARPQITVRYPQCSRDADGAEVHVAL